MLNGESAYPGVLLVAATLGVCVASAAIINARFVRDGSLWRYVWVVFVQEAARLPLVLHSAVTNEVFWRGRKLRITRDHTMNPVRGGRWAG